MQTAMITPRPPGCRYDAFPSTCEKAASAASVAATRAPPVQMLWRRAGQGKRHTIQPASADAFGSPFGSQMADRL